MLPSRLLAALLVAALLPACALNQQRSQPVSEGVAPGAQLLRASALPLSSPDEDVLYVMMAAELLLQQGEFEAAAPLYARAAELSDDPAVAERAVRVAFFAEDDEASQRALARWRELDTPGEAAVQIEATVLLRSGELDAAMEPLMRLFSEPDGWRQVGQAIIAQGDGERALGILARLSVQPAVLADQQALLAYSQMAAQFGDGMLAQLMADQAIGSFPEEVAVWQWHGQLAEAQEDVAVAERSYARAVDLDPSRSSLRVAYAGLLHDRGETRRALDLLLEAPDQVAVAGARFALVVALGDEQLKRDLRRDMRAFPQPLESRQLLIIGQLSELLGEYEAALESYQQIPPQSEAYVDAALRRSVVLAQLQRLPEALEVLHERREQPGIDEQSLANSYLLEAELLREAELLEEAFEAYERGLQRISDEPRMLYARALLAERMDRLDVTERDLRRLLELDPEDGHALNALGYTLTDRTERHEEALGYITRALDLLPDEPAVIDSMGWVRYRLGDLEAAERYLRRAYELQDDGEIAAHLGEVLYQQGNTEEALAIWADALQREPDSQPLLRTIERFEPSLLP